MYRQLLILLLLNAISSTLLSQEYEDWDDHDVIRFYKKIDLDSYTLDQDGEEIEEVYVTTKLNDGLYEVSVYKVSSNLYQIQGTDIYMFFRYSPYLYSHDEGVLRVSYNSGTFYEKP